VSVRDTENTGAESRIGAIAERCKDKFYLKESPLGINSMFEFSFVNDMLLAIHKATGIDLATLRYTFRILIIAMIMPPFVYVVLNSIKYLQTKIGRIFSRHSGDGD